MGVYLYHKLIILYLPNMVCYKEIKLDGEQINDVCDALCGDIK